MTKTPFEQMQENIANGTVVPPTVGMSGAGNISFIGYQLSVHHFNLKLMAKGLNFRGITFTQIKKYYGLKGRSAVDCLPQFEAIKAEWDAAFNAVKAAVKETA